jgi:ribonuclease III
MTTEPATSQHPPLEDLEAVLGHTFRNRGLLEEALQHASFANEREGVTSSDRLEFLGDAVVGLVAGHLLFSANPAWDEGALTRALHGIVDRRGLAELSRRLGVGAHLRLGSTERQSDGHEKDSILADAMEAVMGAIFLDAGLEPVRALVKREFAAALEPGAMPVGRDPKTLFQESVMALHGEFPIYNLERDTGLEGDEARFTVSAIVQGIALASGTGRTKRAAEFVAAERALARMASGSAVAADRGRR